MYNYIHKNTVNVYCIYVYIYIWNIYSLCGPIRSRTPESGDDWLASCSWTQCRCQDASIAREPED